MNAIEIKGLSKSYGDFSLNEMNLVLPTGSIMGLVGENGAGKSTTIKLIMNAISRSGGSVRVLGVDNESPEFCMLKNDIGVVLDETYFPEQLNAKDICSIMEDSFERWDSECFWRYAQRFELPGQKPVKDFSRGMKMKLSIAAALSHNARLLILDEATGGLDPMVRDDILDVFNDFTRDEEHSILLSSHIVSDLEKICDYIAFIHKGRLLLCEEKDRLLEEYALVRLPSAQLDALPAHAVISKKVSVYGSQALVVSSAVSDALPKERPSLEEIILFLAKGDE